MGKVIHEHDQYSGHGKQAYHLHHHILITGGGADKLPKILFKKKRPPGDNDVIYITLSFVAVPRRYIAQSLAIHPFQAQIYWLHLITDWPFFIHRINTLGRILIKW